MCPNECPICKKCCEVVLIRNLEGIVIEKLLRCWYCEQTYKIELKKGNKN
jgi:hypothetical protein